MEERIGSAVIGLLCVGVGVLIFVLMPDDGGLHVIAALVIGALGAEAVLCALLGRRSLLSRIGPLP